MLLRTFFSMRSIGRSTRRTASWLSMYTPKASTRQMKTMRSMFRMAVNCEYHFWLNTATCAHGLSAVAQ